MASQRVAAARPRAERASCQPNETSLRCIGLTDVKPSTPDECRLALRAAEAALGQAVLDRRNGLGDAVQVLRAGRNLKAAARVVAEQSTLQRLAPADAATGRPTAA